MDLFEQDVVHVLLEKHGMTAWGYSQTEIGEVLSEADKTSTKTLIDEIVSTNGDLRNRVSPLYRFDERWQDFEKCLLLDGFKIKEKTLLRLEPVIESTHPVEDDLTNELNNSNLVRRKNPGPVGQVRDKWLRLSNINEVFRQRKALPFSKGRRSF